MAEFRNIGLVGRPGHSGVVDTLKSLLALLLKKDVSVILDQQTAELLPDHGQAECVREDLGQRCDLVIVVGGDGSMLSAARAVANGGVPVIGVNRGRLGFLTDILPEEIEPRIDQVLSGRFTIESRFLLEVESNREGDINALGCALNDVVLHPGRAAQMIEFELFVDDRFVYSQASDGLIVATPTGSTAYALSAGGPIMHPSLNAIALVPMHPHSLSSRPIVVDGESEIRIVVGQRHAAEPKLSCDGEVKFTAMAGDQLLVRKKSVPLELMHPLDHNFYQACRSKLGWGSRLISHDDESSR